MLKNYPKNWHKYDLCFKCAYDSKNQDISPELVVFINRISKIVGPTYILGYVSDSDNTFTLLLRAGTKFVRNKAIQDSWRLLLDPGMCKLSAENGNPSAFIHPFQIDHDPSLTRIHPFQYIYAPFKNTSSLDHLYYCKYGQTTPFDKSIRIQMLMDFLYSTTGDNNVSAVDPIASDTENANVYSFRNMVDNKIILDYYAIHDFHEIHYLRKQIFYCKISQLFLPLDALQNYFGSKVALDFCFFEHVFASLLPIVIVGIAFQVLAIYYKNFSSLPELPPFAFFISFSFILTIQSWKKSQQIFDMKWTSNPEKNGNFTWFGDSPARSSFLGKIIYSPINGYPMVFYSDSWLLGSRIFLSRLGSFLLFSLSIISILVSMSAIYYVRFRLRRYDELFSWVQYIASGGTGFVIILYNNIFHHICTFATNLENHRTEEEFLNHYSVKMIIFQAVNTLCTFYYLAFGARHVKKYHERNSSLGECGYDNCVYPITINAFVIIFMEVVWRLVIKLIFPFLKRIFFLSNHPMIDTNMTETVPIVKTFQKQENSNPIEDCYPLPSTSQFNLANPMASPKSITKRADSSPNESFSKPTDAVISESYNFKNNEVDLNEDIFVSVQDNVADGAQFFEDTMDKEQGEGSEHETREREEEEQDIGTSNVDLRENDGFSSAGELTPQPSRDRPENFRRNSNLENVCRYYEHSDYESKLDFEDLKEGDGSDSEEEINFNSKAPFEMVSRRSYDINYSHLDNHLFIFRLLCIATCFGVAVPGVFFVLILVILLDTRIEIWRLLYYFPRPLPAMGNSIGLVWTITYDILCLLSAATNSSLIILTLTHQGYSNWKDIYLALLWIGIMAFFIAEFLFASIFFSLPPVEVQIQNQRRKFIVEKLIEQKPDHEDSLPIEML